MNKNQSVILKGIALLMMVFIHIDLSRCQSVIDNDYIILYEKLQSLCVPVPLFLIGGGVWSLFS